MQRRVWFVLAVSALLAGTMLTLAQAPAPVPTSLRLRVPDVYFVEGTATAGTLAPTAPAEATPCSPVLTANDAGQTLSATYTLAAPTNQSYRGLAPWVVTLEFTDPDANTKYAQVNFTITVRLTIAGQQVGADQSLLVNNPSSTPSSPPSFTFTPVDVPAATGDIQIKVDLKDGFVANAPPLPPTPAPNNVALKCGTSKVRSTTVAIGNPGEGDLNGNGIPDSTDPDRDGDGVANDQDGVAGCNFAGAPVDFSSVRFEKPGDHDGDGASDQEECAAGTDPLSPASLPVAPTPFPWGTIIFFGLLLLLLLLFLLNFFIFGRVATLSLLTSGQLIVPRGGEGKFEILAQSTRKGGQPITFQLAAQGLPESWDAKLSKDHVTLGPQGEANNQDRFWLTVEAPEHEDAESAVVNVRAIPLRNGRKDTFRTAASLETITSINVPPNAKVPVRRGNDPRLLTEEQATAAAAAAAPVAMAPPEAIAPPVAAEPETPASPWQEKDRPVVDIQGIGEKYTKALEKMDVTTIQRLHAAETATVAKKTGAPETTVRQWQAMAELIDVQGVGPQVAELLVRAGTYSIPQLATSDPKDLVKAIEATNEGREVQIQGGPAGAKSAKNWIKAAGKHPLAKEPVKFTPPAAAEAAPAAAEPVAEEKPKKRGLFGRSKEPDPAPAEAAPAEPAAAAEPAPEAEAPKEKKRFGLFGKKKEETEAAAPEAPPADAPAAAPAAKPNLQVGGLQHSPATFRPGEDVKSTVSVTNAGDAAQTIKLSLFVNENLADAQTVSVKPGKTKDVKFAWTAQERNKLNIRGELVGA